MEKERPVYWFPRKKIGIGYGLPVTAEGWGVLAAYLVLQITGVSYFSGIAAKLGFTAGMTVLLIAIVFCKGER